MTYRYPPTLLLLIAGITFLLLGALIPTRTHAATLMYQNDFENGWGDVMFNGFCPVRDGYYVILKMAGGDTIPAGHEQFKLTTTYARSGKYSARTMLDPRYACLEPSSGILKIRSEITMGKDWGSIYRFTDNVEHWYGVSLMIDPDNSLGNPPYTIMQQMKVAGITNYLRSRSGRWEYVYETPLIERGDQRVDLGPIEKGKWTDFVFRLRPSAKQTGIVEIWVNGVKKYSKINTDLLLSYGDVTSPVTNGTYEGQYGQNYPIYGDKNLPFLVYIDSVKIAQGSDGYTLVAPSGAPPTSTTCQNTLTSTTTIPTGYGASYNLFSSVKELLVRASCSDSSIANFTVGLPTTYTYTAGYSWDGSSWQKVPLSCKGSTVSTSWCAGEATASVTLTENPATLLGYTCYWSGTSWKCGCRDSTCATPYWQMQRVGR